MHMVNHDKRAPSNSLIRTHPGAVHWPFRPPRLPMVRKYKETRWMMSNWTSFTGATCAALLIGAIGFSRAEAADQNITVPQVIICELNGVRHFAYLDRIDADGTAIYMTPSGKFATVSEGGVVTRQGQAVPGSCAGKTLEDLRAAGQARSFGD